MVQEIRGTRVQKAHSCKKNKTKPKIEKVAEKQPHAFPLLIISFVHHRHHNNHCTDPKQKKIIKVPHSLLDQLVGANTTSIQLHSATSSSNSDSFIHGFF